MFGIVWAFGDDDLWVFGGKNPRYEPKLGTALLNRSKLWSLWSYPQWNGCCFTPAWPKCASKPSLEFTWNSGDLQINLRQGQKGCKTSLEMRRLQQCFTGKWPTLVNPHRTFTVWLMCWNHLKPVIFACFMHVGLACFFHIFHPHLTTCSTERCRWTTIALQRFLIAEYEQEKGIRRRPLFESWIPVESCVKKPWWILHRGQES